MNTLNRLIYAAAALVLFGAAAVSAAVPDSTLMGESFQQFDQQMDTGWRTLRVKQDYPGAADAILQYQSLHAAELSGWQKESLAFHLGGVYALAGDKAKAIEWFQKSLDSGWSGNPAYIQGFIAFLDGDRAGLETARHTVATTNPGPWQKEDLDEMDTMLAYFGEPFEAAWGALNCHDPGIKGAGPEWIAYCKAIDMKYRQSYVAHGIKLPPQ